MRINPKLNIIDAKTGRKIGESEIREKTSRFCAEIQEKIQKNDVISIDFPRSFDTICAIISCLQLEVSFTFCEENKDFPNFRTTLILDGDQIRRIGVNYEDFDGISYVITTSGTTGKPKQVAVPGECIWPNIDDFCSLFSILPADSILFSTSLCFDPSIVELFMAFRTGCTLILTPDHFRNEPFRLQKAIEQYRPTVAQFTATVLEMIPSVASLLNTTSSLRILLIGGSHFPLKFINSHRSTDCSTRIFNVYGVTEVSCWATIQEIEMDCEQVLIGDPIGGSTLRTSEQGELLIGGPRQCYVNGVKKEEHATGDRVEEVEGGGMRIVGRTDRMIKHRGIRICLDALTLEALRQSPDASSVHFMHHNNRNLVQFVVGPSSSSRQKYTTTITLPGDTVVPITVCHVASLPINSSGKVDEKELARSLEASVPGDFGEDLLGFLKDRLKIQLDDEILNEKSFSELGIKSLLAVEMAAFFPVNQQDDVVRTLLDGKTTLRNFLETFRYEEDQENIREEKDTVTVKVTIVSRPAEMLWEVNLGKCIDGNILVINDSLVVCASHSGVVCAVNPQNGRIIWKLECGVRFEATPILVNDEVVIGSKTGGLYFISLSSGTLISRTLSSVRATCSFDDHFVYCTDEFGHCHVIDPTKKSSISDLKMKNGGGSSVGPVVGPDGSVYAVLTSGWIARITVDKTDGTSEMTWQKDFGPLFAAPVFLGRHSIIVLNVHGILRIVNIDNGKITEEISLESGNCFCAPLIIDNQALIATKSGNLVHVNLKPKLEILKIFEFEFDGISFVKTPNIASNSTKDNEILTLISTNGWIIAGRLRNQNLEDVKTVSVCEKEIFTTPEFIGSRNTILVAGRDDHLRAWDVQGLL